ncbi:MAG: hypothetical protein ABL867_00625 [Rickettsiales bacterium]
MASLKNVNWGAIIAGAVIVTGILALAPAAAIGATSAGLAATNAGLFPSVLNAIAVSTGASNVLVGSAIALGGAVLGQKTANLFHRGQDAATTLVGR